MKILEARAELERYRGRSDIRLDELMAIANHLISMVVPEQPSNRVAETLNERTMRYYITEGLVDRPLGKDGTAALYGYRHLLQALVLKALQGRYLPIRRIREILAEKSDIALESILVATVEEIFVKREPAESDMASPLLMGILKSSIAPITSENRRLQVTNANKSVRVIPEPPPIQSLSTWKRIEVEPGFEIHFREDYQGKGLSKIGLLLSKIKNLLLKHLRD